MTAPVPVRRQAKPLASAALIALISATSPVTTVPAFGAPSAGSSAAATADEFDVFGDLPLPAEAEPSGEAAASDEPSLSSSSSVRRTRVEASLDAEAAYAYRLGNAAQAENFPDIMRIEPSLVSGSLEPGISFDFGSGFSFAASGAASFEGGFLPAAASAAPAATAVKFGVSEARLDANIGDVVFLKAGILPLSAGTDVFFKPTAWFHRYSENPYAPGATSFVGIGASAYAGNAKFGFVFLPGIEFPLYGLFAKPSSGWAAEARASLSVLGGNAVLLGFAQAGNDSIEPRFAGAGFEIQMPVSKSVSLKAEGMVSNGLPAWGTANGFLAPLAASEDDAFFAGFAAVSATAFSVLDLGAGYAYDGRGLGASAWEAVRAALAANPAPGALRAAAAQGYLALARGADAFLRHRLVFSLGVPKITDSSGAALYAFVVPEDGSLKLLFDWYAQTAGSSSFHLRLEAYPSAWSSSATAYGASPIAVSISAIADFSVRESL